MATVQSMTIEAASRIYSAAAKAGNGQVRKDSFAARAMSAAMRKAHQANSQGAEKVTPGKIKR
ncbi:hypothetical protein LMG28140_03344 [Paraburkholderia metrosideri]|uniref:SMP domain-containing protein n=1 Tax=Paraburkholderia metrosideri TaxID=580937 RepID=A0ABM8NQZ2_9BURK|nr:hypothetical protein LMG28140_03344 [Paraburkholderia metrosideri]